MSLSANEAQRQGSVRSGLLPPPLSGPSTSHPDASVRGYRRGGCRPGVYAPWHPWNVQKGKHRLRTMVRWLLHGSRIKRRPHWRGSIPKAHGSDYSRLIVRLIPYFALPKTWRLKAESSTSIVTWS